MPPANPHGMRRRVLLPASVTVLGCLLAGGRAWALTAEVKVFGSRRYAVAAVGNGVEASMAAAPTGTVYAVPGGGAWLYRTDDGGRHWNTVRAPLLRVSLNEGDAIVAPNGDVYVSWLDLGLIWGSRVWVSRDGGWTFEETFLRGPQVFPDRPWVVAAPRGQPGPDLGLITANAVGTTDWGSTDGGATWLEPIVFLNRSPRDPVLVPNPWMDYGHAYQAGPEWTPLPAGGFLHPRLGYWTTDFATWYRVGPLLQELGASPYLDISSAGTVYQARFADGARAVEYRFLRDGAWSAWRRIATFGAPGRYIAGITGSAVGPNMALNSRGSLLGINTRDGDQDVLIRVEDADSPSPRVSLDPIGAGCTVRYDYPTLVFDHRGLAVTSYCEGSVAGRVAYELPARLIARRPGPPRPPPPAP